MNPLKLNTTSVSLAVTPTVVSTLLSHYIKRSPLKQKPTAHLSYDEGLHLIRAFLQFASQHTVEELQAFTAQWVPHPQWVRVKEVLISGEQLEKAAGLVQAQLGEDGIRQIGGKKWWQWRKPDTPMKAEWIEMKSDYQERKTTGEKGRRVMLYVHGGAYFFGSVDEHRYQMQRHARKLKARVFAPKYRLAPQFPFPCGLYDCIAAYLHLLTVQEPSEIILAGDSAGGGMVLSMLCILRDQGIPLPAGAILISPWVDLTHSFPSVSGDNPLDYIPSSGFHHKPSRAWPPPNEDDMAMMWKQAEKLKTGKSSAAKTSTLQDKQAKPFEMDSAGSQTNGAQVSAAQGGNDTAGASPSETTPSPAEKEVPRTAVELSVTIDGKLTTVKDQIQMYTTNDLLPHPLVSPVTQPTLGGLPPLLIMAGGGEMLRDEQIYLAHKCANPAKYAPSDDKMDDAAKAKLARYKPTYVQLQVWDDLCHVAPTLSFTRPAKYMYRSIAQFGAWALARAQHSEINILDDDAISVISSSATDDEEHGEQDGKDTKPPEDPNSPFTPKIGKAGDTLPAFKAHMIRQRVTRHGAVYALAAATELPACLMPRDEVGVAKETPVKRWLETKKQWETRYASQRAKVHQKIIKDMAAGFAGYGEGENPPPTALAGRRRAPSENEDKKKKKSKSIGLALWSLWGSKHDELTVQREKQAEQQPETHAAGDGDDVAARSIAETQSQVPGSPLAPPTPLSSVSRPASRSRVRTVVDEHQTSQTGEATIDDRTAVEELIDLRKDAEHRHEKEASKHTSNFLTPDYQPETGVAGKRPHLEGIALPFSLGKDADTASMMTLQSNTGNEVRPMSPVSLRGGRTQGDSMSSTPLPQDAATPGALDISSVYATPATELTRPQMERDAFVTASEDLPLAEEAGKKAGEIVTNGSTAHA